MWFKSLNIYRLHAAAQLDAAALERALGEQATRPLGGSEARRIGWAPPAGRAEVQMLHELQCQRLLTALRQERILPASVVRKEVQEHAEAIETSEGRKLRRQEKLTLKKQVFEELLARAFVRSQKVDLWWDTYRQLIGINAASRKRAEKVLDLLRKTLGSLKITPLTTHTLPMRAMTTWLNDPASQSTGPPSRRSTGGSWRSRMERMEEHAHRHRHHAHHHRPGLSGHHHSRRLAAGDQPPLVR